MLHLEDKRNLLILKLYELHITKGARVNIYELEKLVGIERVEFYQLVRQLGKSGLQWLRKSNEIVYITPEGEDKAERLMKESYSQKKRRVLETLQEMSGTSRFVSFPALAERVGIPEHELAVLCSGLDDQGHISFPGGDYVEMKDAGYEELEPKKPSPPTMNVMNIQTNYGAAAQGSDITQKVYQSQPVSEILPHLLALIEAVRAENFDDKDEVVVDLEKAYELGSANPDATEKDAVWKRIVTKLTAAKTTMEIAGFVVKSYPYWPQVLDFFSRHIQ